MKTTSEYTDLIKAHLDEFRTQFGIRTVCLFGSVSRGEQHDGNDIDVCVEMESRLLLVYILSISWNSFFSAQLMLSIFTSILCSISLIRFNIPLIPIAQTVGGYVVYFFRLTFLFVL